jgi:hypothetical protein
LSVPGASNPARFGFDFEFDLIERVQEYLGSMELMIKQQVSSSKCLQQEAKSTTTRDEGQNQQKMKDNCWHGVIVVIMCTSFILVICIFVIGYCIIGYNDE